MTGSGPWQQLKEVAAHTGPDRSISQGPSQGLRSQTLLNTTMESMSEDDQKRIETVSQFLLQSPPGEINDVLNGTIDCVFDTQIILSV